MNENQIIKFAKLVSEVTLLNNPILGLAILLKNGVDILSVNLSRKVSDLVPILIGVLPGVFSTSKFDAILYNIFSNSSVRERLVAVFREYEQQTRDDGNENFRQFLIYYGALLYMEHMSYNPHEPLISLETDIHIKINEVIISSLSFRRNEKA
jgi:hypothetical protein